MFTPHVMFVLLNINNKQTLRVVNKQKQTLRVVNNNKTITPKTNTQKVPRVGFEPLTTRANTHRPVKCDRLNRSGTVKSKRKQLSFLTIYTPLLLILRFCARRSSARMPSSQSLLYSSLHPHWHPLHQSLCTHWRPAIQRTIGWSVRKAPFAGQGACGKEGTKWKMAMRTRREQQGARCSLTHGARGARGKMHASRCAHQGVRARKELAKKNSKWEQSGKSYFGSHLAFCAKKWFPVRFPIFVPMVSDAFLASILVFSCEQR